MSHVVTKREKDVGRHAAAAKSVIGHQKPGAFGDGR